MDGVFISEKLKSKMTPLCFNVQSELDTSSLSQTTTNLIFLVSRKMPDKAAFSFKCMLVIMPTC